MPLIVAIALIEYLGTQRGSFSPIARDPIFPALVVLWLFCWGSVLLRLGARYAGRAKGPGWTPRRPACVRCGYLLTGLSPDGRCPECGLEVAASLPTPRKLPAWAEVRGVLARLGAFLPTVKAVIRRRDFFRTLSVFRGREPAIRFVVWSSWLMGLWFAVNAAGVAVYLHATDPRSTSTPIAALFGDAIILIAAALAYRLWIAALALTTCRFGRRDPRPTTVVTCYAGACYLVAFLLAPLWIWLVLLVGLILPYDAIVRGIGREHELWVIGVLLLGGITPPVVALLWATQRFVRAMFDIRHASA